MRIVIDTLNEKLVDRELTLMQGRMLDVGAAEPAVSERLRQDMVSQFDTEGRHGSGGWESLSPATIERKRRKGLDLRILHETGALRRSLTIEGARDSVARLVGNTIIEFGTTVDYARFHQHGRGVPQRRPVQLPDTTARRDVMRILQRHIVRGEARDLAGWT